MTLRLEPHDEEAETPAVSARSWGAGARSPQWRLAKLPNPEVNPTPRIVTVGFWVGLAVLTFVILLAGYGTGFWALAR
jgi:hypothetical protein